MIKNYHPWQKALLTTLLLLYGERVYLADYVEPRLSGESVDQQEQRVYAQTQRQEGHNLCAGCVEHNAEQCTKAHASGDRDDDEKNTSNAQASVRADSVAPAVQCYASVYNLKVSSVHFFLR